MKTQLKRTLALLLVLGPLLPMLLVSVQAAQPRYIGTSAIVADLNIQTVGGTIGYAECIGYVELYRGYHATMVVELQQAGTTIKSWSGDTDAEMELCKYWYVEDEYVYRVKVTVYVYNSNNVLVETNSIYTPEQYYQM